MMMPDVAMPALNLIAEIDALLPQTQCGLCGHRDGCLPYAKSIAAGEAANKCVPGGQPVADAIAERLGREPQTAEPSPWPIQADGRPQRMKAVIREAECIGCTKCIHACPVDAIIGSAKLMHSVLSDLCTGCELCIAPCPVDCIDLVPDPQAPPSPAVRLAQQQDLRKRYYAHIAREQQTQERGPVLRAQIDSALFTTFARFLLDDVTLTDPTHSDHTALTTNAALTSSTALSNEIREDVSPSQNATPNPNSALTQNSALGSNAKRTIELAKRRSQIKKLEKQLALQPNADKNAMLTELRQQLAQLEQS